MTERFELAAHELYRRADLGAPRIVRGGFLALNFDGIDLSLSSAPNDEEMWIKSELGALPSKQSDSVTQFERILQLSFALLATHDVLVTSEDDQLKVSAAYRYDAQNIDLLADMVSDVASAAETIKGLVGFSSPRVLSSQSENNSSHDAYIIYQP